MCDLKEQFSSIRNHRYLKVVTDPSMSAKGFLNNFVFLWALKNTFIVLPALRTAFGIQSWHSCASSKRYTETSRGGCRGVYPPYHIHHTPYHDMTTSSGSVNEWWNLVLKYTATMFQAHPMKLNHIWIWGLLRIRIALFALWLVTIKCMKALLLWLL